MQNLIKSKVLPCWNSLAVIRVYLIRIMIKDFAVIAFFTVSNNYFHEYSKFIWKDFCFLFGINRVLGGYYGSGKVQTDFRQSSMLRDSVGDVAGWSIDYRST